MTFAILHRDSDVNVSPGCFLRDGGLEKSPWTDPNGLFLIRVEGVTRAAMEIQSPAWFQSSKLFPNTNLACGQKVLFSCDHGDRWNLYRKAEGAHFL